MRVAELFSQGILRKLPQHNYKDLVRKIGYDSLLQLRLVQWRTLLQAAGSQNEAVTTAIVTEWRKMLQSEVAVQNEKIVENKKAAEAAALAAKWETFVTQVAEKIEPLPHNIGKIVLAQTIKDNLEFDLSAGVTGNDEVQTTIQYSLTSKPYEIILHKGDAPIKRIQIATTTDQEAGRYTAQMMIYEESQTEKLGRTSVEVGFISIQVHQKDCSIVLHAGDTIVQAPVRNAGQSRSTGKQKYVFKGISTDARLYLDTNFLEEAVLEFVRWAIEEDAITIPVELQNALFFNRILIPETSSPAKIGQVKSPRQRTRT